MTAAFIVLTVLALFGIVPWFAPLLVPVAWLVWVGVTAFLERERNR